MGVYAKGINLFMANLHKVDWREGVLEEADLWEANLCGVDLLDATGLTQEQVDSAEIDERTRLPAYLRD